VWVRTNASLAFQVSVEDSLTEEILDSVMISADTQGQWQRFNFTFTPSASSTCGAANQTISDFEQTIYSCSGRF
jgi:hypothetical protein